MTEKVFAHKEPLRKYQFTIFSDKNVVKAHEQSNVQSYSIKKLEQIENITYLEKNEKVLSTDEIAQKDFFEVASIVSKYKNLKSQERSELEKKIEIELQNKIKSIHNEAYQKGLEEGSKQGYEDVYNKVIKESEAKIEELKLMVNEALTAKNHILNKQKNEICDVLRLLTKWVILRELKDDGKYFTVLLEKLILELDAKSNIIIRINEKKFQNTQEALEIIQKNIGNLTNVRIIVDKEMSQGPLADLGIIIETENGLIDGSLEVQLQNLDKVFEAVKLTHE